MLYVRLNKTLYGYLRAALLFLLEVAKQLIDDGFLIDNYNLCVANKLVEGNQMNITWHADNLNISHNNPNRVTNILTHIEKLCSDKCPVSQGKKHK